MLIPTPGMMARSTSFMTSSQEGFAKAYYMYGEHADIISPASLKTMIKDIGDKILKKIEL